MRREMCATFTTRLAPDETYYRCSRRRVYGSIYCWQHRRQIARNIVAKYWQLCRSERMTDHELNELRRIERLALFLVNEEDWATYVRLQEKRRREVAEGETHGKTQEDE